MIDEEKIRVPSGTLFHHLLFLAFIKILGSYILYLRILSKRKETMLDSLLELYNGGTDLIHKIASDIAKGEPFGTAAVLATLLAAVGYAGRNIPLKLYHGIINRCTVMIQSDNSWDNDKRDVYFAISEFITKHQLSRMFRINKADVVKEDGVGKLQLKYGIVPSQGLFFFKGRMFYYTMQEATEQGAVPAFVTLRTFGRDPDKLLKAIRIEEDVIKNHNTRNFYERKGEEWEKIAPMNNSTPIFLAPEIKDKLDKQIDFFKNNRQWYIDRGLSHKLLIVLEGPPGSGKSRIGRYVADRLGYSLGSLMTAGGLTRSCRAAANNNIVVSIPDVDAVGIGRARKGMGTIKQEPKNNEEIPSSDGSTTEDNNKQDRTSGLKEAFATLLSDNLLAEALNLFQGDIPVNNLVCIMSTNCIEDIDAALTRGSRCDLKLHIGALTYNEVNEFYKHSYKCTEDLGDKFKDIRILACNLMDAFKDNAFNKENFVKEIEKHL